jgi:hypothetical protein
MKRWFGWLVVACLVVACGGNGEGPPLGDFPAISKKETDAPFNLAAPSSRSPAPFTFTSSNTAVATIDGTLVTIKGAGESTITASQPSVGSFGPTSKSTTLTVTAVTCEAGSGRANGVCSPCVAPATVVNNQCVAPASTTATKVTNGALTWMAVTNVDTWAHARDFCNGSVIEGTTGWRLPTVTELNALYASGATAGHNWGLGNTWSSIMASEGQVAGHVAVNLVTGMSSERGDDLGAYVSCVK